MSGWKVTRIIFLITHTLIFGYVFYTLIILYDDNTNYDMLFNRIQSALTAIVSLISYVTYFWRYKWLRNFMEKIKNVDDYLKILGVKDEQDRKVNYIFRPLQILLGLIMASVYAYCMYIRLSHTNREDSLLENLKHCLIRTYLIATNWFVMASFINYILIGKHRFRVLNEYLTNWVENDSRRIVYISETDELNCYYLQTTEFCDTVREAFQVPIFVSMVSDMLIITYMVLTAFNEFVSGAMHATGTIFCIVDHSYRILQIILIIGAAVGATHQAQEMADCLQRLMIETDVDFAIKERLKLFLMEMVDRRLCCKISGFLVLDYGTFVAMVGSISTYLLIMMQFRPPGDNEESKATP